MTECHGEARRVVDGGLAGTVDGGAQKLRELPRATRLVFELLLYRQGANKRGSIGEAEAIAWSSLPARRSGCRA